MKSKKIFLVIFLIVSSLDAMHIAKKSDEVKITPNNVQEIALRELRLHNPDYSNACVYHFSGLVSDVKNLNNHKKKRTILQELNTCCLVTLSNCSRVFQQPLPERYFLVDFKLWYILRLKSCPRTANEKIKLLSGYVRKNVFSSTDTDFSEKIPCNVQKNFKAALIETKKEHRTSDIVTVKMLDKQQESGFFVLFRLKNKQTHNIENVVYELESNKKFVWDKSCCNLKNYYEKHVSWIQREIRDQKYH